MAKSSIIDAGQNRRDDEKLGWLWTLSGGVRLGLVWMTTASHSDGISVPWGFSKHANHDISAGFDAFFDPGSTILCGFNM